MWKGDEEWEERLTTPMVEKFSVLLAGGDLREIKEMVVRPYGQ